MDFAGKDAHSEGVEYLFLDSAFEGAGTIDGVVAGGGDLGFGGIGKFEGDAAVFEAIDETGELDFDNLLDLIDAKGAEHDDVIEAVDELGPEVELEFFDDL